MLILISRAINDSRNDHTYGIDYERDMSKFELDGDWTRCMDMLWLPLRVSWGAMVIFFAGTEEFL